MLLKSFALAAAGLAATTQAFLIPPEITEADKKAIESVSVEGFQVAESHSIALSCPGCPSPFGGRHGRQGDGKHDMRPFKSHLELNITVNSRTDGDHLLLNDFELYPNPSSSNGALSAFIVPDRPKRDKLEELKSRPVRPHVKPVPIPQPLGFGLRVTPVAKTEDDMLELIALDFQIVEVGQTLVDGIPAVHINLIKAPDAKLAIQSIEMHKPESIGAPKDGHECTTMLCKWRAMIANRVKGGRHCGGHRHPHHHGARPHREGDHHHHHHHRWSRLFSKFYYHILAPVVIGVTAGIGVSLIFMGIWGLTLGLWRKVVRGQSFFPEGRRCSRSHKVAPKEAAVEDEKSGLMEHQDPPPSYEDEVTGEDKV